MIQGLRKIGNSQGILLSKSLLQWAGIGATVDVAVTPDGLLLRPVKKHPRDGWDEAFAKAIATGDAPDGDLFAGTANEFDRTDWTW
jgi:antitoxin MazE